MATKKKTGESHRKSHGGPDVLRPHSAPGHRIRDPLPDGPLVAAGYRDARRRPAEDLAQGRHEALRRRGRGNDARGALGGFAEDVARVAPHVPQSVRVWLGVLRVCARARMHG